VFTGSEEPKCPHCRRVVDGYGYTAFALKRKSQELEGRTETAEATLKKFRREHGEALSKVAVLVHESKLLQERYSAREREVQRSEQVRRAVERDKEAADEAVETVEASRRRLMTRLEAWETWGRHMAEHVACVPQFISS